MKNIAAILLSLFVGLGVVRTDAAVIPAVETANGTAVDWRNFVGANQSASVGWSFVVGPQDLELDALGLYDQGGIGLQDSHAVGIWASSGSLLAQTTIPSGSAGSLIGSYRYVSVAPLMLLAGHTYIVGAYFGPVADICGGACGDSLLVFGEETYAPGITFSQSLLRESIVGGGSLAFPNLNAGIPEGVFGPNFLLAAGQTDLPEPSSLGLMGVGLGVLLTGALRRSRPCF
ncbi:MAG: hypothetical protein CTY16_09840 [Methylobacter sp.]|nr:MAG: hypothetical protein CTY16_09840 [Methylobacter sp.]